MVYFFKADRPHHGYYYFRSIHIIAVTTDLTYRRAPHLLV
jgi:hypothetical protein